MFGSTTLEVAIGIVFVFILFSTICAAIRESLEAWFKTRAAYLERGVRELLHDKDGTGLAQAFFTHPLILSLYAGTYKAGVPGKLAMFAKGNNLPSYIPSRSFAVTLMDIAARGPTMSAASSAPGAPVISLESIRANVLKIQNEPVQRVVLAAVDTAQGDLSQVQANLEAWYDGTMDRVSGWYKRSTHWIIFWVALALAVALNVNTITIADYLYRNDAVRNAIVARAQTASTDTQFLDHTYQDMRKELDALGLPIGWQTGWSMPSSAQELTGLAVWQDIARPILGWLMTAVAATLGAPFWFDLLNKMMVIRSTVKPTEKSPDEGSEDRQPSPPPSPRSPPVAMSRSDAPASPVSAAPRDVATAPDPASSIDGCDVAITDETRDEDLPAASGGVA